MKETRKQIIETIGDYMDKTLSEGCLIVCPVLQKPKSGKKHSLISIEKLDRFMIIRNKYIDITYIGGTHSNFEIGTNNETWGFGSSDLGTKDIVHNPQEREKIFRDNVEIIGHYDITAVLKYIDSNIHQPAPNYVSNEVIEIIDFDENGFPETYTIPNKPLHLYSANEEKDLLELLQTIGKQK